MINKLGVDIDGCLNYLGEFLVMIAKRDYGMEIPIDFGIMNHLGVKTKEDQDKFWEKYDEELLNVKREKHSRSVLDKLYKNGIGIFIVTAREDSCADSTKQWLSQNKYSFNELVLNSGSKIDKCKELGIEYMVEDNPHNTMALAEGGVTVLLTDRIYNQDINHKNIIRCKNWYEIEEHLLRLFNLTPIILYSDSFVPTEEFEELCEAIGYSNWRSLECRYDKEIIEYVNKNSDNFYKACTGKKSNLKKVGFDGLAYIRYVDISKKWAIRMRQESETGTGIGLSGYYEGIGYLKEVFIKKYNYKNCYYEFNN